MWLHWQNDFFYRQIDFISTSFYPKSQAFPYKNPSIFFLFLMGEMEKTTTVTRIQCKYERTRVRVDKTTRQKKYCIMNFKIRIGLKFPFNALSTFACHQICSCERFFRLAEPIVWIWWCMRIDLCIQYHYAHNVMCLSICSSSFFLTFFRSVYISLFCLIVFPFVLCSAVFLNIFPLFCTYISLAFLAPFPLFGWVFKQPIIIHVDCSALLYSFADSIASNTEEIISRDEYQLYSQLKAFTFNRVDKRKGVPSAIKTAHLKCHNIHLDRRASEKKRYFLSRWVPIYPVELRLYYQIANKIQSTFLLTHFKETALLRIQLVRQIFTGFSTQIHHKV